MTAQYVPVLVFVVYGADLYTNRHEFPSQQRMKADSERIVGWALPTFGRAGSRWAMPTLRQPIEIMTFLKDFHANTILSVASFDAV